jgi:hypothetical protein
MLYAQVHETTLVLYPYGFTQLQEQNPYTNYGDNTDVAYWFPQTETAITTGDTLAEVIIAPQPTYDVNHQNCILNANPVLADGVWTVEWTISNFTPEEQAAHDAQVQSNNSAQAQSLLSATDWTAIASVADPLVSNPYLTNQAEFLSYRSAVRAIGVNPPVTPAIFPTVPTQQWSN